MIKRELNIIGYRRLWYILSALSIALSLGFVSIWGVKLGIDFTGGSLMELSFSAERPSAEKIKEAVPKSIGNLLVTPVGDQGEILRFRPVTEDEHQEILASFDDFFKSAGDEGESIVREERFTSIGPTIGAELKEKAVWATVIVLLAIVLYIAWAFRKVSRPISSWQYGATAIAALFHDIVIIVGVFSLLGKIYNVEIGALFITALLTVLGFSVHDTIVVFDRVRENLSRLNDRFPTIVNKSLNQTLARSINTSFTTLLVLLFTLFFGGASIKFFVLALVIGIIAGTYSSIFIAAPLLVSWFVWREKKRIN